MYTYTAILRRVVDGDTYDLDLDLGFHIWAKQRIRLKDYDTPERGQPNFQEAKLFAEYHLKGKQFVVRTFKEDVPTYNRWVGQVVVDNQLLGELLKEAGLLKLP